MAGQIPPGFDLATDSEFRILSGFSGPVRAGRVTAILGTGQLTVQMDDQDGGSATAWTLNGFTYAVNDVVYVLFANNHPESGIVVGSKNPADTLTIPELDPSGDLILQGSGGNVGIGGTPGNNLEVQGTGNLGIEVDSSNARASFVANAGSNNALARVILLQPNNRFEIALDDDASGNLVFAGLNAGTLYMVLTTDPYLGIDQDDPQGLLHLQEQELHGRVTGVGGTAVTLLPNGTGDVVGVLHYETIVWNGFAKYDYNAGELTPGNQAEIFNNGTGAQTCDIIVNSDGSVDVQRTTGTLTYEIRYRLFWM